MSHWGERHRCVTVVSLFRSVLVFLSLSHSIAMSAKKATAAAPPDLSKQPFSNSQLIIGLFLSTYFLSVELIEFSLSIYVLQENKTDFYRDYLVFKRQAMVWKWWQMFTSLIVPLSIFDAIRGLYEIVTKKATLKRNLLDIIKAVQLFGILYTIIVHIMPLETKLIEEPSREVAEALNGFHWIAFLLNILGWLNPLLRYQDWQSELKIDANKKKN